MRILLIEDDVMIGDGIVEGLKELGFVTDWFTDGADGEEALYYQPYDAVILDLGLPGRNGLAILKTWRAKHRNEPVLILTAYGNLEQRIQGLESGADDYLPKPFALTEVAARLKAIVRRRYGQCDQIIEHGALRFNLSSQRLTLNGRTVALTATESMLLELFMLNKNKVLSKNTLEEKIYAWDSKVQSDTVGTYVYRLRRKLGADLIKTVYGLGYVMEDKEHEN